MRFLFVALFMALTSAVHAQEAHWMAGKSPSVEERQSAKAGDGVKNSQTKGFPVTIVESPEQAAHTNDREDKADNHETADLKAQERAASAAERSAATAERQEIPTLVFAIAGTSIAVFALIVSLTTAGRADKTARAQIRAYVHVDAADFMWSNKKGTRPSINMIAKNSGATPAKWFSVKARSFVDDLDEDGFPKREVEFPDIDFSERNFRVWSALGGMSELTFPIFNKEDFAAIAAIYDRRADVRLNVVGTILYETLFGEIFESEFWFTRRRLPGYEAEVISTETKWNTTTTKTREVPIKLQRMSCLLKVHSTVKKRRWRT